MRVRRALISVSDKTRRRRVRQGPAGARGRDRLHRRHRGGAARGRARGAHVEELTGAPEILDGRVKTLHPRLHAALLARPRRPRARGDARARGDRADRPRLLNLYPFERTVAAARSSDAEVAIENIDIGGPTMIRAAAKNHRYVAVVVRPESYDAVLRRARGGRRRDPRRDPPLACQRGVRPTARYDAAISRWFAFATRTSPTHLDVRDGEVPRPLLRREPAPARRALHRGRRPRHTSSAGSRSCTARTLSFNNVLDLDSARNLLADLEGPACVIVKHNNPCGAAEGDTRSTPTRRRWPAIPLSAYGGVIALNRPIDEELAERLHKNFVEVLIAPGFEGGALEILQQKQAIRILEDERARPNPATATSSGSAAGSSSRSATAPPATAR